MTQSTFISADANGTQRLFQVTVTGAGLYLANSIITDPTGVNLANVDIVGNLAVTTGGSKSLLNIGAAVAIKAAPGRLRKLVVIAPGSTSGGFTLNDCATTGAAAAANEIWTMAYNATANVIGAIITFDWPCLVGITLSAVPGGGTPLCCVSYD
jgi:hypothetical protein